MVCTAPKNEFSSWYERKNRLEYLFTIIFFTLASVFVAQCAGMRIRNQLCTTGYHSTLSIGLTDALT